MYIIAYGFMKELHGLNGLSAYTPCLIVNAPLLSMIDPTMKGMTRMQNSLTSTWVFDILLSTIPNTLSVEKALVSVGRRTHIFVNNVD
jgi:hypothetical protein